MIIEVNDDKLHGASIYQRVNTFVTFMARKDSGLTESAITRAINRSIGRTFKLEVEVLK